ncbi:hypothetical protein B0I35DRAFT_479159 [Stachybotrys elegans]|uniref:Rhodopsin domain-containing protein n=1 Tax=Stachybotrys elegans TaxID=80388 RepID=A0A8K0SRT4_9HYPO|nr:hypothetical protein B0I35DRAFT_479159 [Stachybotrys elegans]
MADSNFDLSENNGGALVVTISIFLPLSWLAVGLRMFTKIFLVKKIQWDDWLMVSGQAVFSVSCIFILLGVTSGLGRHNEAITNDDDEVAALKWQALATATYILDMMLIKLSIGVFLLRIAVTPVYTWIIRTSLFIIFVWSMVLFFWNMFQCNPVEKQWDFRILDGQCVSVDQIVAAAYAISVMTILSDWLYALLPIPMLWNVKMTTQTKTTVIAILGLGVFASVATLIRLAYLADLELTDDILFAGTDAMVWTLIEPGVALIAASLATIRPLLRAMRVPGFETRATSNSYGLSMGQSHKSRNKSQLQSSTLGNATNDVALKDMSGSSGAERTGRRVLEEDERGLRPNDGLGGQINDSKSEVYVVQGHRTTSSWDEQPHSPISPGQGASFDVRHGV